MNEKGMEDSVQDRGRAQDLLQLVSFKIGEEEFGVDILKVREINRMLEVTSVARGNSLFNCAVKATSFLPNCAKHTPRSVAAMSSGPNPVSRYA